MQKSIVILLILLPFVYSKYSFSPFEIPKAWVIILLAILSFGHYWYSSIEVERGLQRSTILIAVLLLWGWLTFTSLISGNFWQSWAGNYYRADGLMTLSAMMIIGICLKPIKWLWQGIGWGSILMSAWTIGLAGETALRMGNPNFVAGYLAVTLPMTSGIGGFWVIPQLVAIILLKSWGGALAAVIFVIVKMFKRNTKRMFATILLTGIGFVYLYGVSQARQNPQGILVAEGRERIWTKAMIAIAEKPITGWGWSQFGRAFKEIDWPVHYSADAIVDRTHASLTEYGVAGGVVAIGLYVYLAIKSALILLHHGDNERKMLGLTLVLYLIYSQTNVTSVTLDWIFFVGVGEAIRTQLRV